VIIDDLDVFRSAISPDKADPPLIVDADTVLTRPVTAQRLQPVSWNCRHILQLPGVVEQT
jgi:hypothetical protein